MWAIVGNLIQTVAARVAEEMNTKLGQEVGYSIRFEDVTTLVCLTLFCLCHHTEIVLNISCLILLFSLLLLQKLIFFSLFAHSSCHDHERVKDCNAMNCKVALQSP